MLEDIKIQIQVWVISYDSYGMSHTVRVALNCSHYSFLGCYFNNHEDILLPGLHEGFHTFGLRWKRDLLEWFVICAPHRYLTVTTPQPELMKNKVLWRWTGPNNRWSRAGFTWCRAFYNVTRAVWRWLVCRRSYRRLWSRVWITCRASSWLYSLLEGKIKKITSNIYPKRAR